MTPYRYRAFGLALASDAPVPGLSPAGTGDCDLCIHMGAPPEPHAFDAAPLVDLWRSPRDGQNDDDVVVSRTGDGALLVLRYGDGVQFVIRRSGTEVWATWPAPASAESAATYLLGPVMGLVLRLRHVLCLHASTVAAGPHAIAIVGASGLGKSTIAARYALRGGRVLGDDIAALDCRDGAWQVHPAVPGVRLWDDSVELLLGRRDALPLLAPGWDKRVLDLATSPAAFGADESAPLGAVYVLRAPQDAPCPARRLEDPEALLALVSHTYANVLLDAPMRAAEFRALSALVKSVPVWAVRAPAGAAALDRFCAWLAAAPPHGAATPDLG